MGVLQLESMAPEPEPALDAQGALCVVVCVHGSYQDYIPLYIYSVLKSYPDYFVKVFLREELLPHNRRALDIVRGGVSARFEIRENCFPDFPVDYLKAARWLIPQEEVSDFEYVYIGDVDFIICREDPDIRARHVGHCRQNDLPYSNAVRVKDPPVRRLSGLHFIIVKPYYEKMASAMAEMRERILSGAFSDGPIVGNEFLLYEMVDRGIGRFPSLFYRPGHGLHLGVLRVARKFDQRVLRRWAPFVLDEILPDPIFKRIKAEMSPVVRKQTRTVQALCSGHWWYRFL